ncbi:MAG: tRNA (adenosine(37)-N6)-dimethylallyltransferase MiaA [Flavobacteriia bacterium]|nr:tRNA (adenosine(37)-N6)-dimethylallyltransferase MiaA [Flavobacteriia bacterium]
MSKKKLIVIQGPTASGKTALGIALAKKLDTVILSADSRQFYKEVIIGTAKPSMDEQDGIKHYFIDSHSLEDEVSSARFAREALEILGIEFQNHDTIIMVGGSGMFIDAVCIGLDSIPKSDELKAEVTKEFEENGLEKLLEELKEKDFAYYSEVDKDNPMRIIRALEVIRLTGNTFSSQRTRKPTPPFFEVQRFVINHERDKLYSRINRRVDLMLENGLVEEVKSVQHLKHLQSMNTVGYSEIFQYLDHEISLEHAVELIKQNTRRYAKRQLTWFRRHPDAIWIDYDEIERMIKKIL